MDKKNYIELFNRIYSDYQNRYIRFASSYIYNKEDAEDIVAESLIYYWENREKLQDIKNVPLYILVIIKNKCLAYLQRQRTWNNIAENMLSNKEWELQTRISSLEECNPKDLFSEEIQDLIKKTLDQLPSKTSQIFIMNRYEGKNYQTIAQEMGLSVKSVEYHISNALEALRKNLKDYLPCLLFVFDFFYS